MCRMRWWTVVWLVLALGLALSLAAGCGGDGTDDGRGGAVTTYTNTEHGFSLDYDGDLFTETSDTTAAGQAGGTSAFQIGFFDENGTKQGGAYRDGLTVAVYQFDAPIDDSSLPEFKDYIEDQLLPQLDVAFPAGVAFAPVTEVESAGAKGFVTDAAFEMDGTPFKATMYFLLSGDREYQLTFQAAEDRWSELEPSFQEMVDSFSVHGAASSSP